MNWKHLPTDFVDNSNIKKENMTKRNCSELEQMSNNLQPAESEEMLAHRFLELSTCKMSPVSSFLEPT